MVAVAQERVASQQQESLFPQLNPPPPSSLATGKVLGSPLCSLCWPCSFSHLFPVCGRSELSFYPAGNKFLFTCYSEEHPLIFFCIYLWVFCILSLTASSFFNDTWSLGLLLELASFAHFIIQSPFLYLSPSQVFWAAFKKRGCNRRSKMK